MIHPRIRMYHLGTPGVLIAAVPFDPFPFPHLPTTMARHIKNQSFNFTRIFIKITRNNEAESSKRDRATRPQTQVILRQPSLRCVGTPHPGHSCAWESWVFPPAGSLKLTQAGACRAFSERRRSLPRPLSLCQALGGKARCPRSTTYETSTRHTVGTGQVTPRCQEDTLQRKQNCLSEENKNQATSNVRSCSQCVLGHSPQQGVPGRTLSSCEQPRRLKKT